MVVLCNANGKHYQTVNCFYFLVILLFLLSLLSDPGFYSMPCSESLISFISTFCLVLSCVLEDTDLSLFMIKQHNYIIAI